MTLKVYISSSMKDKDVVSQLTETLSRYGIKSFWQPAGAEVHFEFGMPCGPIGQAQSLFFPFSASIEGLSQESFQRWFKSIRRGTERGIDCMLVVSTKDRDKTTSMNLEIRYARLIGVPVIPIIEEGAEVPRTLHSKGYIQINKSQPRLSYERADQYLKRLKIKKDTKNTIRALVLLSIGFLLLGAMSPKIGKTESGRD